MTKTASQYLSEANDMVERLSPDTTIPRHGDSNVVFVDVRDGKDIDQTGTIAGALRIPRGFIEFAADDSTSFHHPALTKDKEIMVVCAAGGMAALTGRTLREMGYEHVYNVGGFNAWKEAGGPVE
jgi:rhodanese-related sulfurtransferase